jgi:hypothetical protein
MKEIRGVAYSQSIVLVKKLNSINSRIQGWCSAFAYTTEETLRLQALDKTLEDVLTRMLTKHGLVKKDSRATVKIFGFQTFREASAFARLSPEDKKKKQKQAKKHK